jgi:geranylgeranyl pyrophosphate synthase
LKEKLTLPMIHLLGACEKRERAELQRQLREQNEDDLQRIIHRLLESGSITYAKRRAGEFIQTAQQAVTKTLQPDTREMLLELASSILD